MHVQGHTFPFPANGMRTKQESPTPAQYRLLVTLDVSNAYLSEFHNESMWTSIWYSKLASGQARGFGASLIPLGPLPRNSVGCASHYENTSGDRGVTRSSILLNGDKRPKLDTIQHHSCERDGKGARYQAHKAESMRATSK
jgi:hypothetical protein